MRFSNTTRDGRTPDLPAALVPSGEAAVLPRGAQWRSSDWFLTLTVMFGLFLNNIAYTLLVPCYPFQFAALGYADNRISGLTSYLLVTIALSKAIASPLVGLALHRRAYRLGPLSASIVILVLALVAQMLARPYWVLVISRVAQGVSSAIMSAVGMALINENVSVKHVGKCICFGFAGSSLGLTLGPPIGGILYKHLGWHSPFICVFAASFINLILNCLAVERRRYPTLCYTSSEIMMQQANPSQPTKTITGSHDVEPIDTDVRDDAERQIESSGNTVDGPRVVQLQVNTATGSNEDPNQVQKPSVFPAKSIDLNRHGSITFLHSVRRILAMPRALSCFPVVFCASLVLFAMDVVITLRLKDIWGKDSAFAGLIYLGGGAGTIFMGTLTGILADRVGPGIVVPALLLSCLLWIALLLPKSSLALFCTAFCFYDTVASGVWAPIGRELGVIGRTTDGIEVLSLMAIQQMFQNLGVVVGCLIGGAVYDKWSASFGWTFLVGLWVTLLGVPVPVLLFFMGEKPVSHRVSVWVRERRERS